MCTLNSIFNWFRWNMLKYVLTDIGNYQCYIKYIIPTNNRHKYWNNVLRNDKSLCHNLFHIITSWLKELIVNTKNINKTYQHNNIRMPHFFLVIYVAVSANTDTYLRNKTSVPVFYRGNEIWVRVRCVCIIKIYAL